LIHFYKREQRMEVDNPRSKQKGSRRRMVLHSMDKVLNSPGGTRNLIDSDQSDGELPPEKKSSLKKKMKAAGSKGKEMGDKIKRTLSGTSLSSQEDQGETSPGDLLRRGLKFASQDSFMRFVNMPGKGGKNKKRKSSDHDDPEPTEGSENPAFNSSVAGDVAEKSSPNKHKRAKLSEDSPSAEPSTKPSAEPSTTDSVHRRFDSLKLKAMLNASDASSPTLNVKTKKSIMEKAKDKLQASRFRYLNEQLYTQTSAQSAKMFKNDSSLFSAYHQGFQVQANVWPSDPLDTIIAACLDLPESHVVVDMGCGEARLAKTLPNLVHSFDLVSVVPGVVECDMSRVPLKSGTVDLVVFCLSLMGTNIKDFLLEATRILKVDGIMKIAELESRFQGDSQSFIRDVEKFGFKLTWKNLKNQYFQFFDFKKIGEAKSKKKLPNIALKACVYKKR